MRVILSLTAVVLLSGSPLYGACGVERWSVKTGTDPQASLVALGSYVSSTIYNFHQSVRPASLPSNGRVAPRETTQYRLSGTLTKYVRESDSDYHLVINDSSGRTMIIELPASNCVGAGGPFGTGISHARQQFDARFTATTSFKTTSTPVTVKGVGFWDFLHGQTGVAPNGIEVHPVLDITFGSSALSAETSMESEDLIARGASSDEIERAALPDDMVFDDDGGRVRVYRGGDALGDPLFHGGAVVDDPSLHVLFAGDWPVASMRPVTAMARHIDAEASVRDLDRYGVRTFGFRVQAQRLTLPAGEINDLDVQRALLTEVEAGRIQLDPNAVYVVVLDGSFQPMIGQTRDWFSYHSQFHPTEMPMRYVVVRGGLDAAQQQQAMTASVARALINPAGDGWF
ncbi:MAG: hypothetical protein ABI779_05630 [Acidobacteriota bacterium]